MPEEKRPSPAPTQAQVQQFKEAICGLFHGCQERAQAQSARFRLPDAELRALMLFGNERYLTPKGVSQKLAVTKSRVTKIIDGLVAKAYVQRVRDPGDSRIYLLSLTAAGHKLAADINAYAMESYRQVLLQMPLEQRQEMLASLALLRVAMETVRQTST